MCISANLIPADFVRNANSLPTLLHHHSCQLPRTIVLVLNMLCYAYWGLHRRHAIDILAFRVGFGWQIVQYRMQHWQHVRCLVGLGITGETTAASK